ncbi:MAG TPA: lipoate protein ligase C-terminal domain-containing protein [Methanofastidiosum sp.]|nr:lipoate protein ligase C-terminal domain-containing protein [Methanofastidiosum sp.]HPA49736.1 lipoate protein ligase C-terminal domain-containing protein [Methanofastidiosum sp.]HQK63197.1 lipoate protein ligase C-terminal domain-containing protein [Methanofastidiosum sp.]HQQ48700.1 lipoate protein ligase C-terminal domain-containing protein [Methanofastidiosum sp.]
MRNYEYKKQGGKLIGVSFNYVNNIFFDVKIYGDFFIFPEDSIEILERSIEGKNYYEICLCIDDFFSSEIKSYGIKPKDIKELFKGVLNDK